MAKEIRAGVELTLKDGYSAGIRNAGSETGKFADKTLGALNQVDKALSGTAAKLAAFGLSFSLGAVTKDIIELDHRMARVGLTAGASAEQVAALKRAVFEAAKSPDIKLDPTEIVSALETIMTKTGDLKFAEANIRNIALAIQAAGEAGGAMGDVFSEFAKNGYSAEQISRLMDDMIAQSDQGEFTFAEFAKNAKAVLSAYSAIGSTPDDVRRANAAMQVLTAGTKSAEAATTVLNSAINELRDPRKRAAIEKLGIKVRDLETGKLRDFNDIMLDLAEASQNLYKADIINSLFGSETIKAISAYSSEFSKKLGGLLKLGDTAGKLSDKSATMARTLQSNIQGLKTSFYEFADLNLTAPLAKITELLNDLTAHPERVKRLFTEITLGLGAIAAVKGIAGIARIIESMKGLKGGTVNITESLSMAGAMPVYVTNWGGGAGLGVGTGTPFIGTSGVQPRSGLVDQYGNPLSSPAVASGRTPPRNQTSGGWQGRLPSAKASAGTAAAVTAVVSGIGLAAELYDLSKNETLDEEERKKRQGGAAGEFTGNVAGAAAGAFIGSLILPGVGTIVGSMIGSQLGGMAGRWGGEKLGAWKDRTQRELETAQKDYEQALGETANTLGKTEEEIESVRQKLIEAEARLEKAKEASEAKNAEEAKKKRAYEALAKMRMNGYNPPQTARTGDDAAVTYGGYVYRGYKRPVNDLIVTPRGQFSTHPDDYIFAMKNPADLAGNELRREARTVERIPQAMPPVTVIGEIKLQSELTIDDKGGRLRQSVVKNTTPYKFSTGNSLEARVTL